MGWHPAGVRGIGGKIRWCRFAQPPATSLDASGIKTTDGDKLGCLGHRLTRWIQDRAHRWCFGRGENFFWVVICLKGGGDWVG